MELDSLRREVRNLRMLTVGTLIIVAILATVAASHAWSNATFDKIDTHRINIVDREGKLAMVLASHDDEATPVILGHRAQRVQGNNADNGIVFFNQKGDEQGGLIWSSSLDRASSADTLSFDTAQTDQLLQVDDGSDNGEHYAYLIGWHRAPNDAALAVRAVSELQHAHTDRQRAAILAKYRGLGWRAPQRFFLGYRPDEVSQLVLSDGQGRPRIKMFVTPAGKAELDFLDADGHVASRFPPK